jgi:hypothetical protein
MMEAVRISETSAHLNVITRRHIPEDSKLHTPWEPEILQIIQGFGGKARKKETTRKTEA